MNIFNKKKYRIYPIIFLKLDKTYITNECSICMEKFNNDRINIPCGHNFHSKCILDWFEKDMSCPICRIRTKFNKINK
jgi:hypothetical protein